MYLYELDKALFVSKNVFYFVFRLSTIYQCKRHTRKASFANFPAALARRPSFRGPWLYFTIFRKDHYNNFYLSNTIKRKKCPPKAKASRLLLYIQALLGFKIRTQQYILLTHLLSTSFLSLLHRWQKDQQNADCWNKFFFVILQSK